MAQTKVTKTSVLGRKSIKGKWYLRRTGRRPTKYFSFPLYLMKSIAAWDKFGLDLYVTLGVIINLYL